MVPRSTLKPVLVTPEPLSFRESRREFRVKKKRIVARRILFALDGPGDRGEERKEDEMRGEETQRANVARRSKKKDADDVRVPGVGTPVCSSGRNI